MFHLVYTKFNKVRNNPPRSLVPKRVNAWKHWERNFVYRPRMTEPEKTETWQCTRCLWILTGREGDEIAEHTPQCPFHGTGDDPDVGEVQVGGAGSK